ncbi:adenosylhomocysteinase [Mucilaginibacter gracilis]|nr:adenosylhomocysteinase [Mucilaginibacter gracilis]
MKKLALTVLIIAGVFAFGHAQTIDTTKQKKDTVAVKSKLADGSSFDRAIVIAETSERTGNPAEYLWIKNNYPNSRVKGQTLSYRNKKPYDILHIINAEGVALDIYFDISNFFGKF